MFLPEQPYITPGTLRDQFLTAARQGEVGDEQILDALRKVHLETLVQQVGGLDAEQNWETTLSLGERQMIAFARLLLAKPEFAFLDRATIALNEARGAEVYQLLARFGNRLYQRGRSPAEPPGVPRRHTRTAAGRELVRGADQPRAGRNDKGAGS